jgi:hypothetical protein
VRIGRDQLEDYAHRQTSALKTERRLRPFFRCVFAVALAASACSPAEPTIVDRLREQTACHPLMATEDV